MLLRDRAKAYAEAIRDASPEGTTLPEMLAGVGLFVAGTLAVLRESGHARTADLFIKALRDTNEIGKRITSDAPRYDA